MGEFREHGVEEGENLAIPEYELSEWLSQMTGRVNSVLEGKDRAVVNLAGASASGKGEAAEALAQRLRTEGRSVLVFSTDDFYKGISRMIIEGILEKEDIAVDQEQLVGLLREAIGDKPFDEKTSEMSMHQLRERLADSGIEIDADKLISMIQDEFAHLDFDNPRAVDLPRVSSTLSDIREGKDTPLPQYSMKISEPVETREINPQQFDVVLVEGIYGLNDGILQEADVKSFIETDIKTLLMRRFRRDVLSGRTSFPPDVALWITLEIVLPAYRQHIAPNRKNADIVLKNDYTGNETFDTEHYDVQDKIALIEGELEQILQQLGDPEKVALQHDFYFASQEDTRLEHLIRLRTENGRLKDLVHKGTVVQRSDGKVVRPTEEFIKDGQFGVKYSTEEEVIEAFRKGGFEIIADISKTRKVFKKDDVEIVIDSVEGLGDFIELRTNDKLSKSPNVDKIVAELGLSGRKPVGPYADEYVSNRHKNPEIEEQQELLLNEGSTRENILGGGLCETIEVTDQVDNAFAEVRRGYPEAPLSEQSNGRHFREGAELILGEIARLTLSRIDTGHATVVFPWRSGIAFAKSFSDAGVNNFYHLSSKRDEETLSTVVDYEKGTVDEDSVVVIADPMLATGNTIIDAIERMVAQGVKQENIIINSVVAAPVGVSRIKKNYPEVQIIVGSLDHKLDHRGYIVPGLGDFGDKYFSGLSPEELHEMVSGLGLDAEGESRIIDRIKKQGASEALSELIQRDMKDQEIDRINREQLVEQGLEIRTPAKVLKIDTGRVDSVTDVVDAIASEASAETSIFAIEGSSGTGKSTTAHELKEKIGGAMLSMGEVFRFLTYCSLRGDSNFDSIIERLHYEENGSGLALMDGENEVASDQLRSREVESSIPEIASVNQKRVIEFVSTQLTRLKEQSGKKILIEGRGYTLDFLPSDLRIKLIADPSIRAERRWNQMFNKNERS